MLVACARVLYCVVCAFVLHCGVRACLVSCCVSQCSCACTCICGMYAHIVLCCVLCIVSQRASGIVFSCCIVLCVSQDSCACASPTPSIHVPMNTETHALAQTQHNIHAPHLRAWPLRNTLAHKYTHMARKKKPAQNMHGHELWHAHTHTHTQYNTCVSVL